MQQYITSLMREVKGFERAATPTGASLIENLQYLGKVIKGDYYVMYPKLIIDKSSERFHHNSIKFAYCGIVITIDSYSNYFITQSSETMGNL